MWALDVVLPEEPISNPQCNFEHGDCAWFHEGFHSWPRNRKFLSEKGAQDRAQEYRLHGADVTVIRSDPVTFQELTEKTIRSLQAIVEDLS